MDRRRSSTVVPGQTARVLCSCRTPPMAALGECEWRHTVHNAVHSHHPRPPPYADFASVSPWPCAVVHTYSSWSPHPPPQIPGVLCGQRNRDWLRPVQCRATQLSKLDPFGGSGSCLRTCRVSAHAQMLGSLCPLSQVGPPTQFNPVGGTDEISFVYQNLTLVMCYITS
jgi:hypothetical protein